MKRLRLPHVWDAPYRPLFLAAAVWAFTAIAWWPLGVSLGLPAPGFTPVVLWHVHELIFGFFGLAIAGYLLTALPGWVGHAPEHGAILKALMAFWTLSRLSMALADRLPAPLLLIINSLFFGLLAALILSRTLTARAYGKAVFALAVLAIGTADALFVMAAAEGDIAGSLSLANACLIGLALLVAVIATRLIPAFTENWRLHRGEPPYGRRLRRCAALPLQCCFLP